MKKEAVRSPSYLHYIPRVLAFILIVSVAVSLGYIYLHGEGALASASSSEKYWMSIEISESEDYQNNISYSERYNCTTDIVLSTSDGVLFTDTTAGTPAFFNLIGYSSALQTRYLADVYGNAASRQNYHILTGIRMFGDLEDAAILLTVNAELQERMYEYLSANGVEGFVLAYQYSTGSILCAVSTPGASSTDDETEDSQVNKCLYDTPAGSTMKIVTLLLLAEQGVDLESLSYTCTGSYQLSDGTSVNCTGVHGQLSAAGGVASSCNAWFAQAVVENLDLKQAIQTLKNLGFSVNGSNAESSIGLVTVSPGTITLDTDAGWSFSNVWSLLGETTITVEPSFMMQLAAACVSDSICSPCFLQEEEGTESTAFSGYAEEMAVVREIWQEGAAMVAANYPDGLTVFKTGTYEFDDGSTQKNIMGASAEYGIAFFIAVENYSDVEGSTLSVTPAAIAEELLQALSE